MDFFDPFKNWKAGAEHPAPDSEASPMLSSILNDTDEWYDGRNEMLQILKGNYVAKGPSDDTVQVLRAFLMNLPKKGQLALMTEIRLFKDRPDKLRQLRNFLVVTILKPLMAAGGKDPKTPITPAIHRDAEDDINLSITVIESSHRADQERLKADCLRREGYRCAVTRIFDKTSVLDKTLRDKIVGTAKPVAYPTQCAHILPFALRSFDDENVQETANKATIWWALHRYFPDLKDQIGADSVNQQQNAWTLHKLLHEAFGSFEVAFEPLGGNRYRTCWFTDYEQPGVPSMFTLTSMDPAVALPNSDYLYVHFCVAEILAVSGIRAKIEEAREQDEHNPLNVDPRGSTDIGAILRRKMLIDM